MTPEEAQNKLKKLTEGAVKGSKYTITGIARDLRLCPDVIRKFRDGKGIQMTTFNKVYNYLKEIK